MNKIFLMGNLTRDPEINYTQSNNMAVARISIAVGRRFKRDGEPETDFFNCVAFGKTAEFLEKYFHKGSKVLVMGRVQNDNYTNKNGEKVYSVKIIVEEVEFAEKAGNNKPDDETPAPPPVSADDDFVNIDESKQSEIPFFQ